MFYTCYNWQDQIRKKMRSEISDKITSIKENEKMTQQDWLIMRRQAIWFSDWTIMWMTLIRIW